MLYYRFRWRFTLSKVWKSIFMKKSNPSFPKYSFELFIIQLHVVRSHLEFFFPFLAFYTTPYISFNAVMSAEGWKKREFNLIWLILNASLCMYIYEWGAEHDFDAVVVCYLAWVKADFSSWLIMPSFQHISTLTAVLWWMWQVVWVEKNFLSLSLNKTLLWLLIAAAMIRISIDY